MKFSIITPSFNQGKYIRDTLESVLTQQFNCDLEHLVIDGASTDETTAVLSEYADKYSNLSWWSEPDRGQSDAINKGFNLAQGEIIAYLNSDDYYLPGVLERVHSIFEQHPEVDFVYGDLLIITAQKRVIKRYKSIRTSLWRNFYVSALPQPSCFWRKRVLDLIPPFNIENRTCMDGEYFSHSISQGLSFCRVSEPLAYFRLHSESITGSGKLQNFYLQDVRRIEQQFIPDQKLPRSAQTGIGRLVKYYSHLTRPSIEFFQSCSTPAVF
jgi:glycosyltransferase involved in cell wall biosynthesis